MMMGMERKNENLVNDSIFVFRLCLAFTPPDENEKVNHDEREMK